MFWEFATDSYDIGFGVYFEWTIDPPTQVSVQVSESSDEEDLDEEYPEGWQQLKQQFYAYQFDRCRHGFLRAQYVSAMKNFSAVAGSSHALFSKHETELTSAY